MARQIADRLCSLSMLFPARTSLLLSPSWSSSPGGSSTSSSSPNTLNACRATMATILVALTGRKTWLSSSLTDVIWRHAGKASCAHLTSRLVASTSRPCVWIENQLGSLRLRSISTSYRHGKDSGRPGVVPTAAAGANGSGRETQGGLQCDDGYRGLEDREIMVQHLLVKEDQLSLLLDLERKVNREGVDLSDLAVEHSLCPSKDQGGMLGWIGKGKTVPEFEQAAFTAPLNKVVRVKTKHGWHLLQVLAEREAAKVREISVVELGEKLKQTAAFVDNVDGDDFDLPQLIDVRELSEIEIASLPYFRAFPLSQFGKWAPSIAEVLDRDKETIVLCHHGVRSLQMAEWLCSQGFTTIKNVTGGIDAYSRKVDPSVSTY